MPPSVARLEVDVSGPKPSPCGLTAALRASWTTPGPTRAVRRSTSISWIWSMWREVSSTMPPPPAVCPARLVPAPRVTIGTPRSAATLIAAATSAASRGKATDRGGLAYMLASPA